MSNKRDLKAFVRFDGSGRIVAGSLILRKKKPKVGKWHEIQAYECCNYIPTPTTTTTTSSSTSTTTSSTSSTTTTTTTTAALFPVTVYYQGGSSTSNLCPPGSEGSGTVTLYSTTPTVQVGSIVYTSNSTSFPLTFGGFYYKQVGESLVFYAPDDNGVVVAFNC